MSRQSQRFSYAQPSAIVPTRFLGQSGFFDDAPPRQQQRPIQNVGPKSRFFAQQQQQSGLLSADDKQLLSILGGGLIIALLIDAVAHASSGR